MIEKEKTQSSEEQTNKERTTPQKPDGILTKKINRKTFVTEIYFDKESMGTFQDNLLKVVKLKRNE
ncbi:transposon-encoded protein TnpW [Peptostreptococcaceae bacterium AS15]|nr:transposon-encoded protein TnpW [Peptostreptococcaceae bacterium AS15]